MKFQKWEKLCLSLKHRGEKESESVRLASLTSLSRKKKEEQNLANIMKVTVCKHLEEIRR